MDDLIQLISCKINDYIAWNGVQPSGLLLKRNIYEDLMEQIKRTTDNVCYQTYEKRSGKYGAIFGLTIFIGNCESSPIECMGYEKRKNR